MAQKIKSDEIINIGANIRILREKQDINQTEMARRMVAYGLKMSRDKFAKIENGSLHISGSELEGIRDVLHTTYDELLMHTKQ